MLAPEQELPAEYKDTRNAITSGKVPSAVSTEKAVSTEQTNSTHMHISKKLNTLPLPTTGQMAGLGDHQDPFLEHMESSPPSSPLQQQAEVSDRLCRGVPSRPTQPLGVQQAPQDDEMQSPQSDYTKSSNSSVESAQGTAPAPTAEEAAQGEAEVSDQPSEVAPVSILSGELIGFLEDHDLPPQDCTKPLETAGVKTIKDLENLVYNFSEEELRSPEIAGFKSLHVRLLALAFTRVEGGAGVQEGAVAQAVAADGDRAETEVALIAAAEEEAALAAAAEEEHDEMAAGGDEDAEAKEAARLKALTDEVKAAETERAAKRDADAAEANQLAEEVDERETELDKMEQESARIIQECKQLGESRRKAAEELAGQTRQGQRVMHQLQRQVQNGQAAQMDLDEKQRQELREEQSQRTAELAASVQKRSFEGASTVVDTEMLDQAHLEKALTGRLEYTQSVNARKDECAIAEQEVERLSTSVASISSQEGELVDGHKTMEDELKIIQGSLKKVNDNDLDTHKELRKLRSGLVKAKSDLHQAQVDEASLKRVSAPMGLAHPAEAALAEKKTRNLTVDRDHILHQIDKIEETCHVPLKQQHTTLYNKIVALQANIGKWWQMIEDVRSSKLQCEQELTKAQGAYASAQDALKIGEDALKGINEDVQRRQSALESAADSQIPHGSVQYNRVNQRACVIQNQAAKQAADVCRQAHDQEAAHAQAEHARAMSAHVQPEQVIHRRACEQEQAQSDWIRVRQETATRQECIARREAEETATRQECIARREAELRHQEELKVDVKHFSWMVEDRDNWFNCRVNPTGSRSSQAAADPIVDDIHAQIDRLAQTCPAGHDAGTTTTNSASRASSMSNSSQELRSQLSPRT